MPHLWDPVDMSIHMSRSRGGLIAIALGAIVVASACGGDATAPATTPPATTAPATTPDTTGEPAAADTATIEINNFSYGTPLTVPVGTTVRVINRDAAPHTFTAKDGSFNSGALGEGEEFLHTFTEAGEFEFECTFHLGMSGSITVTDEAATNAPTTEPAATTPRSGY